MRWIINISSNYFKTIIGMVVVFLLTPFTISMIGKDMFGLWAMIFAVIGLFGLMDFGFATAAVKYVAERTGAGDVSGRNKILSTLLGVYSAIGLACLLIVALVAGPASGLFSVSKDYGDTFSEIIWMLGIVVAVSFPAGLFKAALIGSGRMYLVNVLDLIQQLLNAGLTVGLLASGRGIDGLAISTASSMLITSLLLIPLAYRTVPELHLSYRQFSGSRVRELMTFSVYAFIANIAMLVILRMAPVVISYFLPLAAVATYAISLRISEYTYLLNKQFSNALMPLVSHSHGSGDKHVIRRVLLDGTRFQMAVSLPFVALLFYYADQIIVLWVGHQFDDSIPLLRILLIAVYFSATQLNVANVLGMTGFHRFVAFSMATSAAVNLFLSVMLVRFWGLYGVAFATLIAAFLIETAIMIPRACREQGVSFLFFIKLGILPSVPAAIPMLLLSWFMNQLVPASTLVLITIEGGIAALVYALVFFYTGVKREERRDVIEKILRRLRKAESV